MAMDVVQELPFSINQEVESKSFGVGYRSAWFRCKIRNTKVNKNRQIYCTLEFFDYPGEKIRWNKLYHKLPRQRDQELSKDKLELMLRPAFPCIIHKSQLPELLPSSEVIAVIDGSWKIGDLVDWWYAGCYWSGRISQLLENDQVMIDLPDPPIGEGKTYTAECKDLRPSLDWTLDNGWTIPIPKEHDNFCSCVQLIHPNNNETMDMRPHIQSDGLLEEIPNISYSGSPASSETSSIPAAKASFWQNESSRMADLEETLISSNDHATSASGDSIHSAQEIPREYLENLERVWINEKVRNSTSLKYPGSIESSIVRLQMLLQKIKWLKDVLKLDFERSDAMKPSWEFAENCASQK